MSIAKLPTFYDMKYTTKDGDLTPDAFLYNDSMFQSLNNAMFIINDIVNTSVSSDNTVTNNGITLPLKTAAEIEAYRTDNNIPAGTIWYNTDTNKLNYKQPSDTISVVTSVP